MENINVAAFDAVIEPTWLNPDLAIVLVRKFFDRSP